MKLKRKLRSQLTEILLILVIFATLIIAYLGLKILLNTDKPLVVVASGSMRPTLEVGDLVVVQGINITQIKENDIIVFRITEDHQAILRLHRVIDIRILPNNTRLFITKGDNNTSPDSKPVKGDQIYGRVMFRIPLIGYLILDPMIPFAIIIVALIIAFLWPEKKKRRKRRLHTHRFRSSKLRIILVRYIGKLTLVQ